MSRHSASTYVAMPVPKTGILAGIDAAREVAAGRIGGDGIRLEDCSTFGSSVKMVGTTWTRQWEEADPEPPAETVGAVAS